MGGRGGVLVGVMGWLDAVGKCGEKNTRKSLRFLVKYDK